MLDETKPVEGTEWRYNNLTYVGPHKDYYVWAYTDARGVWHSVITDRDGNRNDVQNKIFSIRNVPPKPVTLYVNIYPKSGGLYQVSYGYLSESDANRAGVGYGTVALAVPLTFMPTS